MTTKLLLLLVFAASALATSHSVGTLNYQPSWNKGYNPHINYGQNVVESAEHSVEITIEVETSIETYIESTTAYEHGDISDFYHHQKHMEWLRYRDLVGPNGVNHGRIWFAIYSIGSSSSNQFECFKIWRPRRGKNMHKNVFMKPKIALFGYGHTLLQAVTECEGEQRSSDVFHNYEATMSSFYEYTESYEETTETTTETTEEVQVYSQTSTGQWQLVKKHPQHFVIGSQPAGTILGGTQVLGHGMVRHHHQPQRIAPPVSVVEIQQHHHHTHEHTHEHISYSSEQQQEHQHHRRGVYPPDYHRRGIYPPTPQPDLIGGDESSIPPEYRDEWRRRHQKHRRGLIPPQPYVLGGDKNSLPPQYRN